MPPSASRESALGRGGATAPPPETEKGPGPHRGPGPVGARRWSAASCSPTGSTGSTIGARGLNFRVRHGTGCASPAMAADRRRASGPRCGSPRALRAAQHQQHPLQGPHPDLERMRRTRARPISTARLRRSHALHLRPIDLVVYEGPYRKENSSQDRLPA